MRRHGATLKRKLFMQHLSYGHMPPSESLDQIVGPGEVEHSTTYICI